MEREQMMPRRPLKCWHKHRLERNGTELWANPLNRQDTRCPSVASDRFWQNIDRVHQCNALTSLVSIDTGRGR